MISSNKDRDVSQCDVTGAHETKENPVRSFVKRVKVASHCEVCLSLLFELMLYLTLNDNYLLMNINTLYFYNSTLMD